MSSHCSIKGQGLKGKVKCSGPIQKRNEISDDDCKLIKQRAGISRLDGICESHFRSLVTLYTSKQVKCCKPFKNRHKKIQVTSGLRPITAEMCILNPELNLVPGFVLIVRLLVILMYKAVKAAMPALELQKKK